MNAKVVLVKGEREKVVKIFNRHIYESTLYKTRFDAECVYSNIKTELKNMGWRAKAAVISENENMDKESKPSKFLGHRVNSDGTVGE